MSKKRYTEEKMIGFLLLADSGVSVAELIRQHGFSNASFYGWKKKFGGMDVNEAKRLRSLEEESRRLKRLVADQALDIQMLKDANSKTC